MRRALCLLPLLLALLPACRAVTEVVVVVSAGDVAVPRDVDTVIVTVPATGAATPPLPLCPAAGAECLTLPLSVTLIPGPTRPDEPATVMVLAQRGGQAVIRMGATFVFTHGERQRLDFTLHARCLGNLACAEATPPLACGEAGACVPITPVPLGSDAATSRADLAAEPADLAAPLDLAGLPDQAGPRDLALPPDMTAPPDLVPPPDLALPPADLVRVPLFTDSSCVAAASIARAGGFPASTCAAFCASVGKSCADTCTTNRGKAATGVEAWVNAADCMAYAVSGGEAACLTDLSVFSNPQVAKYRCCCR